MKKHIAPLALMLVLGAVVVLAQNATQTTRTKPFGMARPTWS